MVFPNALKDHLASGATTVARAYAIERKDGLVLGFTDHDRDLGFDGIQFHADSGLTAKALQQATGLAVDNTEAFGALRSDTITEADIAAGRYDGAEVRGWLVNWTDVSERVLQFRGTIGEVVRSGGAFTAELRGLTEALNQPQGRLYHARCSAVLGDTKCRVNLDQTGYSEERMVEEVTDGRIFGFSDFAGYDDRWFEKGVFEVLTGDAAGLTGVIKNDRLLRGTEREVELWQAFRTAPLPGDLVRIEAGCDRRSETCRLKFDNLLNFRGFPDIPGEDWVMSYPASGGVNDGGSRR
ncbi:MAG: DUF2163 domain-containing protein [Rhodobacteraceae bacterium]|nr:DUF2163 domain-containing protein [Paracoccaceae bacterium]